MYGVQISGDAPEPNKQWVEAVLDPARSIVPTDKNGFARFQLRISAATPGTYDAGVCVDVDRVSFFRGSVVGAPK